MRRPVLVVMVKEPLPGRVKTRLARDIGAVPAAWWYRHQCARLLRRLRDPRWDLVLAVSPDGPGRASRVWPADLPRIRQGSGDLGARMERILRGLARPVLIVGSDIPGIRRRHIAGALRTLVRHDAVLGPAPDGGYWLIGLGACAPISRRLFSGVRWSTAHAMNDTLATLAPLRVGLADTLSDVDTAADLT